MNCKNLNVLPIQENDKYVMTQGTCLYINF
jgi:hypothetical protein